MRTTVTLDAESAGAVDELRRRESVGVSEAVNRLIHAGLVHQPAGTVYRHRTSDLGLRLDVGNVGEVLDLLDHLDKR